MAVVVLVVVIVPAGVEILDWSLFISLSMDMTLAQLRERASATSASSANAPASSLDKYRCDGVTDRALKSAAEAALVPSSDERLLR